MNLAEIIDSLELTVLTEKKDFSVIQPTGGYAADLLSCVMTGAPHNGLWLTLQAHGNIVAVAALLELSAIIITENAIPDMATISRANQEGVILLSSVKNTFTVAGMLWELGIRSE
ncbi:MAG TPA: DRTGG domain-containing protein [Bellilinea sp.]